MNYENMSDFEINKAVAEKFNKVMCTYEGGEVAQKEYRIPDYCNNPSDAWPIIVENKIGGHWGKADPGAYFAVSRLEEFVVMNKNPLRAAMIVYLMMKGSQ